MLMQPQQRVCMTTVPGGIMSPTASAGPAAQGSRMILRAQASHCEADPAASAFSSHSAPPGFCTPVHETRTFTPLEKLEIFVVIWTAGLSIGEGAGAATWASAMCTRHRARPARKIIEVALLFLAMTLAAREGKGVDPSAGQMWDGLNARPNCSLEHARQYCSTVWTGCEYCGILMHAFTVASLCEGQQKDI